MSAMPADPLANALFPKARQAVIGLLFGHPDESFYLREIVASTGLGMGHVQRELGRLASAQIIVRVRRGRQVDFQANPDCPIYEELRGIARKTAGVASALRHALAPLRERIAVAFVFGSIARGEEHRKSDIDLIVIGDVTFADVVDAVRCVERDLRREVNPSVYTQVELANKLAERNHFLTKVLEGKKLFLIGTQDELAAISRK